VQYHLYSGNDHHNLPRTGAAMEMGRWSLIIYRYGPRTGAAVQTWDGGEKGGGGR